MMAYESSGSASNDILPNDIVPNDIVPNDISAEADYGDQGQRGSSDEDKDNMTPAQSRRKAQNRAAYKPPVSTWE